MDIILQKSQFFRINLAADSEEDAGSVEGMTGMDEGAKAPALTGKVLVEMKITREGNQTTGRASASPREPPPPGSESEGDTTRIIELVKLRRNVRETDFAS